MKQNVSIAPLLPYHTLAIQSMFQASLVKWTIQRMISVPYIKLVSRVIDVPLVLRLAEEVFYRMVRVAIQTDHMTTNAIKRGA